MQRKSHLALAIVVLLSLSSPVYAAAPKAGSKCTKAGQTSTSAGIKYTCVKSGKKLVWNKGVAVKKPAPVPSANPSPSETPTPSPTQKEESFTPWATSFTQKQVSDEAQKKFREWALVQPDKSGLHKFISHPDTPGKRARNFKKVDELDVKLFGQFFTKQSTTVLGSNEKWVVDQLNANGGKYEQCDANSGNQGLNYCLDQGASQGYVITSDQDYQATNPGGDGSALLSHEYFHIVQRALLGSNNGIPTRSDANGSKDSIPVWFVEGTANFVGFSVAALALDATYWEGRPTMFKYAPKTPDVNRNTLEDYEIRNGPGNNSPTYPYIAGQLASEYLVASVGFQKMLDIWLDFKNTKNFEKSFENAVGISKDAFYSKFEAARGNLGLPPVTWKLVCLTNTLISQLPNTTPPCNYNNNNNASNPGEPTSPIRVSTGDIVVTGSLQARATWNVTGHESYRLYVTDVVDFQKVYFETGYVNDSRNPLVIDIKGLVCKKEFRTMTEFFTEKNGKGERLVMPSFQLRDLPCP